MAHNKPRCEDSDGEIHRLQIGLSVVTALLGALCLAIIWNKCNKSYKEKKDHTRRSVGHTQLHYRVPNIRSDGLHPGVYGSESLYPRRGVTPQNGQGNFYCREGNIRASENGDGESEHGTHTRHLPLQQISRPMDTGSKHYSSSSIHDVGRKCTAIEQALPNGSDVNEETSVMLIGSNDDSDLALHPDLSMVSERSRVTQIDGKLVVFVSRKVTEKGDYLILDNMGISLHVPPGAVQKGKEQLITLVLNWDLGDNPRMTEEESLVSPVVFVGPHGLRFQRPCTLSYKHCAYDSRHIQVMHSETCLYDNKDWQILCDQQDDSGRCVITQDECQLRIDSFTLFTCVQRPSDRLRIGKWLQIAAFSNPLKSEINHHQVRVYFLNKTPCALQWAKHNESQFGGKLICPEKAFLFFGNEEDVRVVLKYLSDTWESVDNDDEERVQYVQIWHGQCPHISMCFRQKRSAQWSRELNFQMFVYQETLDNEGEKIVVHATEEISAVGDSGISNCAKHPADRGATIININAGSHSVNLEQVKDEQPCSAERLTIKMHPEQNSRCPVSELEEIQRSRTRYIPHTLATKLKARLDPPCSLGKNWKCLAEELGIGGCIDYIESGHWSPTETLLKLVEHRDISLDNLAAMFEKIGRIDAASLVRDFIQQLPVESTEALCTGSIVQHSTHQRYTRDDDKVLNIDNSIQNQHEDQPYLFRRDATNRVW